MQLDGGATIPGGAPGAGLAQGAPGPGESPEASNRQSDPGIKCIR